MPIKTTTDEGITRRVISSSADMPTATITLHPAEGHDPASMILSIEGSKGEKVKDLKAKLGITGTGVQHVARQTQLDFEVPRDQTGKVLESLGLSRELGGRNGVTIKISHDTADHGASSISIVANDPKAPGFTVEHADSMGKKLATSKGVLPDSIKSTIIKENPHLAARVMIDSTSHGGTRIEFKPVDSGNLGFSIAHDAKTGADVIKFPTSNDPVAMQALNTRVTAHLQAHGIQPTGSNIDRIQEVAALHKADANPLAIAQRAGSLTITLPKGQNMGEQALMALSKDAPNSLPIVAKEIANVAKVEVQTVRTAAVVEHAEHASAVKLGKGVTWGGIYQKIAVAIGSAGAAGLAAAAEAPEGERLSTGVAVGAKSLVNGVVPGAMETDTCKKRGEEWAYAGGAVGGAIATGATVLGVGITAIPTVGVSVATSPLTTAAAGFAGAGIGATIGSALGEGVCNLARAATSGVAADHMAQMKYKPDAQTVATNKTPDQAARVAQSSGTAAGRG